MSLIFISKKETRVHHQTTHNINHKGLWKKAPPFYGYLYPLNKITFFLIIWYTEDQLRWSENMMIKWENNTITPKLWCTQANHDSTRLLQFKVQLKHYILREARKILNKLTSEEYCFKPSNLLKITFLTYL
jgi:hypothetical protein